MININRIHRLDEVTVNKIAAGEVVERPASAVKELVENAIDSGATRIEVEIKNGGRQLIKVTDNGCGMEREEAVLAIERHTTSKITAAEDLWNLHTLGFRGEALPSIAAVSQFELITKPKDATCGTLIEVSGGIIKKVKDTGAPDGTTIKVQDLFFNTPARQKYLKSIPTEAGYISDIISRLSLGYPEISFKLQHHQYELLFTPGTGSLNDTIVANFGKDIFKELIPFTHTENGLKIQGFIGKPSIARTNRNYEIFFINRRYFQNKTVSLAAEKAYHTLLPIARYPFLIIFLEVDSQTVDINAHPTKLEVRFANESDLFKTVFHAVRNTLKETSLLAEWVTPTVDTNTLDKLIPATVTPANLKPPPPVNLNFNYQEFREAKQQVSSSGEVADNQIVYQTSPTVANEPALFLVGTNGPNVDVALADGNNNNLQTRFRIHPFIVRETYIIAEDDLGLLFVDQHAAHERILYEKYMSQHKEFLGSQALLIPQTVNLTYAQYKAVIDRIVLFEDLGFQLEPFGSQTIVVRGVPISLANLDCQQLVVDLIEQYMNFETFKDPSEIKESFITTMACRTAIKAGDRLNQVEMESLVKGLFQCENPYTCPHGRPTLFRMSYEELAKKFLRRGK